MAAISAEENGVTVYFNRGFSPDNQSSPENQISTHQQRHRRNHQRSQHIHHPDSDNSSLRSSSSVKKGHQTHIVFGSDKDSDTNVCNSRYHQSSSRGHGDRRSRTKKRARYRESPFGHDFSDSDEESCTNGIASPTQNGRHVSNNCSNTKREIVTLAVVEPIPCQSRERLAPYHNLSPSSDLQQTQEGIYAHGDTVTMDGSGFQSYFDDSLTNFDFNDEDMFANINNVSAFVPNGNKGKVIDMAKFHGQADTEDAVKEKNTNWSGVMTDLFYNLDGIDLGRYLYIRN